MNQVLIKKDKKQLDKIKDFWDKLENSEQLAQEMKKPNL